MDFFSIIILAYLLLFFRIAIHFTSQEKLHAFAKEWLEPMIGAISIALVVMCLFVRSFYIPSGSMIPTLKIGDMLLADMFAYKIGTPNRGDIVTFNRPKTWETDSPILIKRIVGIPQDTIEVRDNVFYLNGFPQKQNYINEPSQEDFGPLTIPEGHMFVMGDNRNNSSDSRYNTPIPISDITGKARFRYFPLSRIGFIR